MNTPTVAKLGAATSRESATDYPKETKYHRLENNSKQIALSVLLLSRCGILLGGAGFVKVSFLSGKIACTITGC